MVMVVVVAEVVFFSSGSVTISIGCSGFVAVAVVLAVVVEVVVVVVVVLAVVLVAL